MSDFLISRPGRPLHLSIWINFEGGSGQRVPICGQPRTEKWHYTGDWAEAWESHRKGGLCANCRGSFGLLADDFAQAGGEQG